jgi:hypothetical protein
MLTRLSKNCKVRFTEAGIPKRKILPTAKRLIFDEVQVDWENFGEILNVYPLAHFTNADSVNKVLI